MYVFTSVWNELLCYDTKFQTEMYARNNSKELVEPEIFQFAREKKKPC